MKLNNSIKHVIFDANVHYTEEDYAEYRQVYDELYGDYEEETTGERPELSDEALYQFIADQERDNWEWAIEELDAYQDDDLVVFADLGSWQGRAKGYKELSNNLKDTAMVFQGAYFTLGLDRYNLVGIDPHHDGTNYYTFRKWKPEVQWETRERFLDDVYEGVLTDEQFKKRMSRYTVSLKETVKNIFGY